MIHAFDWTKWLRVISHPVSILGYRNHAIGYSGSQVDCRLVDSMYGAGQVRSSDRSNGAKKRCACCRPSLDMEGTCIISGTRLLSIYVRRISRYISRTRHVERTSNRPVGLTAMISDSAAVERLSSSFLPLELCVIEMYWLVIANSCRILKVKKKKDINILYPHYYILYYIQLYLYI